MGQKNLELKIELLEGFMQLWKKFHDVLDVVGREKKVSDEEEKEFLGVKLELARRQAHLTDTLELDSHFTDEVMSTLSQIISLKDYIALSPTQVKRIEAQWHNLFILMHGQMGKYDIAHGRKGQSSWIKRMLFNPVMVLFWVVAVLLAIYFLVHKARGI